MARSTLYRLAEHSFCIFVATAEAERSPMALKRRIYSVLKFFYIEYLTKVSFFPLQSSCFFRRFFDTLLGDPWTCSCAYQKMTAFTSVCHVAMSTPHFHSQLKISHSLQMRASLLVLLHHRLKDRFSYICQRKSCTSSKAFLL